MWPTRSSCDDDGGPVATPRSGWNARVAGRADSKETAAELCQRVTSPHGTTAAALDVFEASGFRALVEHALSAAQRRGGEMSAELDAGP